DTNKVVDQVASAFFSQESVNIAECVQLAQIAAKLGATVGKSFHYVTWDEKRRAANSTILLNWLQVLGYAEPPQIDECVGHQLHAIVPTLMVLEPQQQPLKFVLPGKRPFDSVP